MALKISSYIADYLIRNSKGHENKYNILVYGLQIILNFFLVFALILIASIYLNIVGTILIIFIFTSLLRQFSGGIHLKSSGLCIVLSTLLILTIPYLSVYVPHNYLLIIDIFNLVIMLIFAPATFKVGKNKKTKSYYRMKLLSVIIITINILVLHMQFLTIAALIQAVSVIMEFYRLRKVGRLL